MFYADCFAFICSKLYYLRRTKLLLLLILLIPVANIAFGQKKGNKKIRVQIVNSNTFEFDKSRGEKVKRLIGDVQFKQDDILLFCDSAYFYDEENLVEAYSRVRITRSDGFVLSGDFLRYEGDIKRARMIGNVHMTDPSMELNTTEMDFDLDNNIGYYTNGATISEQSE
jgi:lipopolysaccharide assembly outer membrane protein LptD (OstA)